MRTKRSSESHPLTLTSLLFRLHTHLKTLSLLIIAMQTSLVIAIDNNLEASKHFVKGEQLYNSEKYKEALTELQTAVELSQSNSHYHHMLGKCHGRIAENGNWITALRHVGKTLAEFEKAVELDAGNVQALIDLEEFYRRAPGFLGGSAEKALEIRKRLESLKNIDASDNTIRRQ